MPKDTNPPKLKSVTTRLSPATIARLEAYAKYTGIAKCWVADHAINEYLDKKEKEAER